MTSSNVGSFFIVGMSLTLWLISEKHTIDLYRCNICVLWLILTLPWLVCSVWLWHYLLYRKDRFIVIKSMKNKIDVTGNFYVKETI